MEHGYVNIATKVSPSANAKLQLIAGKLGISVYVLMQNVCDFFLRYMDDQHNLSEEANQLMRMFDHMTGWKDKYNLADPTAEPMVTEATYYLKVKGKTGTQLMHVETPFMGQATETYNIKIIFEKMVEVVFGERYKWIRLIGADMGCSCALEMFDKLMDLYKSNPDDEEFREMFSNNDYSEAGRRPAQAPFKRKVNHHIDEQGPSLF